MIKKTITYTDYNDNVRTEDLYFNLSKAELMEMELMTTGGMQAMLEKIVADQNSAEITKFFKTMILKGYGEKSADGKRFIKSEELSTAFSQTEAYSELFMELISDADKAAEFIKGMIPKVDVTPELIEQLPPNLREAAVEAVGDNK